MEKEQLEPLELALCEQEHLILKPNVLYVFRVSDDCIRCKELAEVYNSSERTIKN